MRVKYHQNKNGVGELNEVSNIQLNHLARDVEKEELIDHSRTSVKMEVKGWSLELFCKRQEEARMRGEE